MPSGEKPFGGFWAISRDELIDFCSRECKLPVRLTDLNILEWFGLAFPWGKSQSREQAGDHAVHLLGSKQYTDALLRPMESWPIKGAELPFDKWIALANTYHDGQWEITPDGPKWTGTDAFDV